MKWPLLSIVGLYVAGVLLGTCLALPPFLLLSVSFGLLAAALAWGRRRLFFLGGLVLVAGWTNLALHTATLSPHDLRQILGSHPKLVAVRGVLTETPCLRVYEQGATASWRTLARIDVSSLRLDKASWQPAAGRLAAVTPGMLTNLFAGQTVEITGVASVPKGPVAQGAFDYRAFLREQGIYYRLQADSDADWVILNSPPRPPLADRFRTWARQALARGLPAEDESLRLEWALALGWKTALTEETSEPFVRAATYHIFAVDGLRMAIVFGILFGLLRVCSVPRSVAGIILIPVIWFYVALTGWPASAIRASIMLTIVIGGWALKRPGNLINSLLAAALIILLWQPQQLFQAGFQLSFVVVLYLILLVPRLHEWTQRLIAPDPLLPRSLRRRWPWAIVLPGRFCADLLVTSFAAWLGSIPLVAYYFNIVTPVSTPANVLAVPLCGLVLISNLASLLFTIWLPAMAELFNHAAWFLMECIRISSCWFADWPKAWFYVPAPGLFTTALYYLLLLALLSGWLLKPTFRSWKILATTLAVLAWVGTQVQELRTTRLTVLPAGGALATYFDAAGTGNDFLLDTGNTNAVQFCTKPFLRAQGVNAISSLGLSHGDVHHVGGAAILADFFPVHEVRTSPVRFRSAAYRKLLKHFSERPNFLKTLSRGDKWGTWEVLHPETTDRFPKGDDNALVLRADLDGTRILLLSDLGRSGQEALRQRIPDLHADIIVTGLPSGSEALSDAFIDAATPSVIVVADSELPITECATPKFCERLRRRGIPIIYTRLTGSTSIEFRGNKKWQIRTMNGLNLNNLSRLSGLPAMAETPPAGSSRGEPEEDDPEE